MALPTVSSNSPSAGYIAWTAFGVAFDGDSFPIAAGNTNKKFVWWEYRAGVPAVVMGDVLPALAAEDVLLFLNKNGVGALVPMTDVVDGSLIVAGSLMAPAIAADQIETYHINAGAVTADEIQAGAIGATHISAGAITADKLSVGTVSDNMVVNGSFEDAQSGTLVGWEVNALSNGTITPVTGQSSSGAVSMQLAAATTAANLRFRQLPAQYIPVSAASGRKYYISTRAGASVATTSGHYMRVNWYTATKTLISSTDIRSNGALSTTFTLYEGQATPPATAKYMGMEVIVTNINVISTVYIDEISAHEVTMSAQIGDGQITAAKILAGTITGDRISANTIYADKLAISDFSNWLANGGFNTGSTFLDNWNAGVGVAVADTNFISGRALQNTAVGNYGSRYQTKVYAAKPGDQFYLSAKVKCTVGTGALLPTLRVLFKDRLGVNISGGNMGTSTGPVDGNYVDKDVIVTAPAGTAQVTLWIEMHNPNGLTQTIGDCVIRRMNGGELIVDGAIIASKIATDAVTSDKIIAGAVTASEIAAGAVVADKIAANAVTADKILANSIAANHIAAGAITASKLAVGDFENLATINEVHGTTVTSYGQTQIVDGYNSLVNDTGTFLMVKDQTGPVPFKNGERLYFSFTAKATAATTLSFATYIYNAANGNKSSTSSTFAVGVTDTPITGSLTVPSSDATFGPAKQWVAGLLNVANKGIQIKDVVLRRMNGGELLVDGAITANKLESELVLASKIIAGDPTRTHTEMSPGGFRVFVRDPDETDPLILPTEAIRLGVDSTDDYFAVTKADGSLAASISEGGVIGGTQLNATDSFYYKGTELTEILRRMPKGNVAYMSYGGINVGPISTPQGVGLFDLGFLAEAGRAYRISGYIRGYLTGGNGQVTTQLKVAYDGNTPSINSFDLTNDGHSASDGHWNTYYFNKFVHFNAAGGADAWARVLLVAGREVGPGNLTVWDSLMSVDDVGIQFSPTGTPNTGGGTTTPPKVNYVKQYGCNNSMNYAGGGGQYNYDTGRMYQGLSPAGYGNLKSIGLFPDMTADLSGASINYIRVYFNFAHWYYNGGGTARIGLHGHTGIPGTFSQAGTIITSGGWPKPGARWLDIDSSHWDNFKSGNYRGVSLEGDGTYGTYGYADRPTIEISYTK